MRRVALRNNIPLIRVYERLLRLYPVDYQTQFAPEMLGAFVKAADDHYGQGCLVFHRFVLGELMGLMAGAGAEWVAKLTTDRSVRCRRLPDLRMMRPVGVPREVWFAGAGMRVGFRQDEIAEAEKQVAILRNRAVHAIANHDFPGVRSSALEEQEAIEDVRRLRERRPDATGS